MFNSFLLPLKNQCFRPIFSSLIQKRPFVLLMIGFILIYFVFSILGYHIWICPVKSATGVRCPGCGLTHAIISLLQGKWSHAVREHAFAPVFLAGLILATGISLLPGQWHKKSISWLARLEIRSGFFSLLMISLVGYWLIRLYFEIF